MTEKSSGPRPSLLAPVRRTFRAAARTVVPESEGLDEAGWRELESTVEATLAARPPRLQRQLILFVRVLDLLPVLRHGRRFHALPLGSRTRVLESLQNSGLLLLRRGFWGLRTLVYMGFYTRDAAAGEVGYHAHRRGWERNT